MHSVFFLLAGVLLLCWPTAWICRNRVRFLPIENLIERPALVSSWLSHVVWWNLIRAWFGVWLLRAAEVDLLGNAARHQLIIGYNGVVQLVGLVLQMFFYRTRDNEVPLPVSYGFGVLLAILPPSIALPAVVLGVATSIACRSFSIGWAASGLLVGVLGFLLALSKYQLLKAGLLFAAPLLAVIGTNRQFVVPVWQGVRHGHPVASPYSSRLR